MNENEKDKLEHINFVISDNLKTEFKILLLRQKKNISEVLVSLVERYIEENQTEETIN